MKKQEENNDEINKNLLNEKYDIDNLKNDLDKILNIEDIKVSESLIQATLKRVNEEEQNKQLIQNKQTKQSKQPIRIIGVVFRYGMVAACACVLLVAGISLIANPPGSRKDSALDMTTQEEASTDSSTGMEDMESTETTDTSNDETSEESVSEDADHDNTDSGVNSEEDKVVPSFFSITDEEGTPYTVAVDEISEIYVSDENGLVIHNVTDISDIESLYNTFAKVDSKDHEEVIDERLKGQYVRQYDIIAQESSKWSELHVLISNIDEETSIVTRQLVTSDGKVITHRITDINTDIIKNIINTVP